jgi:asparagine synthase (glutamine-hydrolysing)
MSGIAGIIHLDGAPVEAGLVEKMTAAMAHRGPDGINHWVKGSVALGQCMLRTTPESAEEVQPLTNEDQSIVLVMDGRVDNWEELRKELLGRGAVLRTRADAELVLRAYAIWGRECLSRIDGDFALAIWDARRRTAFCARDRFGNKPFNYHWDGRTLVFASELHAILEMPWVTQELNEGIVADFLNQEWHSRDETPWKRIWRLVAAHWMEVGHEGVRSAEYWRPDFHSTLCYANEDEYLEHYRALLTDTVRRMSRSQQKLAIEVSGGLDSSAIFAVAAKLQREEHSLAPDLAGYTLAFDDDPDANDLDYARAVRAFVGVSVHEVNPKSKPLSWYRDWARIYKEFPGYPNGVMGGDIRELAREQGCRALLVGDGGNEWLDGNRTYYAEELTAWQWRRIFGCLKTDIRKAGALRAAWWVARYGVVPLLPDFAKDIMRKMLLIYRRHTTSYQPWLTPQIRAIASQRMKKPVVSFDGLRFGRAGQRRQYSILLGPYSILAREMEERFAASLRMELRRPFWNAAMVQFAFSTPERLRCDGTTERALHRRAMQGLLPALVLDRKTQADFMIAFRRHADEMRQALSAELVFQQKRGWVLPELMQERYTQFGDKSLIGVPEWLVWSLFGCSALAGDGEI